MECTVRALKHCTIQYNKDVPKNMFFFYFSIFTLPIKPEGSIALSQLRLIPIALIGSVRTQGYNVVQKTVITAGYLDGMVTYTNKLYVQYTLCPIARTTRSGIKCR